MDGLALIVVASLVALSVLPVDWKQDEKSALTQVCITAGGLTLLYFYPIVRGYVQYHCSCFV
jgi:hypothetical protein